MVSYDCSRARCTDSSDRFVSSMSVVAVGSSELDAPATSVFDGDGSSDAAEDTAGTDLDDPGSFFKIQSSSISGSSISLQWVGVAGRSYRVEESSNLTDWTLVPGVAPVVVTANTQNASVTVPANGASKRFVRLQVMRTQP